MLKNNENNFNFNKFVKKFNYFVIMSIEWHCNLHRLKYSGSPLMLSLPKGQSQTDSFNQIIINYIQSLVIKSNLELVQLITRSKW